MCNRAHAHADGHELDGRVGDAREYEMGDAPPCGNHGVPPPRLPMPHRALAPTHFACRNLRNFKNLRTVRNGWCFWYLFFPFDSCS